MRIDIAEVLKKDLRAQTMKAQIKSELSDLSGLIKTVSVYTIPHLDYQDDLRNLKSYGFNIHFYGGVYHTSQSKSVRGLKSAVTRMYKSGKIVQASYSRLCTIFNACIGFNIGRKVQEKIVNDFGVGWEDNPFAINKAWDQLYIYLRQKNIYRTNDYRDEAGNASLFWIPDDPLQDMRDKDTRGIIYSEHTNNFFSVNNSLGSPDRCWIRQASPARMTLDEVREHVQWDLGEGRSYDKLGKNILEEYRRKVSEDQREEGQEDSVQ